LPLGFAETDADAKTIARTKKSAARESAGLQLLHHDRLNPAKGLAIKAGRI